MVEVGRDHRRMSGPTPPCSSTTTYCCLPRTVSKWLLNISKKGHNMYRKTGPVLSHPHNKKVYPDVQVEPPLSQCVPIGSGSVPGHQWNYPGSTLFPPSLQVFTAIDKVLSEPPLLQVEQSQFCQPFLLCEGLSPSWWPFSGLSPVALCLSWAKDPRTGPSIPDGDSPTKNREKGSPPLTCW